MFAQPGGKQSECVWLLLAEQKQLAVQLAAV
jgi:hypothetical protein